MADQPPIDREEMARRLRANIQKRRPRSLPTALTILTLVTAALLLLAWLVWPRPELPRLNLIAFDQVAGPEETAAVEAWLIPQDAKIVEPDLRDLEVFFEDLALPAQPGRPAREVKALSERNGQASAPWPTPAGDAVVELKVSHAALRPRYRTEDRARLFVWKPQKHVLIVEVAALAAAVPDAWRARRLGDLPAQASADKALKAAHEKGYQVIYLAAGAKTPMEYRLMRGWVETKSQVGGSFPDGPVLGQLPKSGTAPAGHDWAERLRATKHRWPSSCAAVVKDAQLAEVVRDAGATTFVLTDAGEVPPNTTRLATWADLPTRVAGE